MATYSAREAPTVLAIAIACSQARLPLLKLAEHHELAPEAGEDLSPLLGRGIGRYQGHGTPLYREGIGLVLGVPQVSRQAIVEHACEHRLRVVVDECDRAAADRRGAVRIATEERILSRARYELQPGRADLFLGVRDAVPDVQGVLEVLTGFRERDQTLRLRPCLDPRFQCPLGITSFLPVVGTLCRRCHIAVGATSVRLKRSRIRRMHGHAFSWKQVRVQGLPQERMSQSIPVVVRNEQLLGDGFADPKPSVSSSGRSATVARSA